MCLLLQLSLLHHEVTLLTVMITRGVALVFGFVGDDDADNKITNKAGQLHVT